MWKTSIRTAVIVALAGGVPWVQLVRSQNADTAQRSVPSSPERKSMMRNHYFEIGEIHDAIIRGDLPAIQMPARHLADSPATSMPAALASFATAMKSSARRVADAKTLDAAAKATTDLLAQCSGCHLTAGIRPAAPSRSTPDVGGMVGHMLEHQRATDALLLGLLLPSPSEWEIGASLLDTGQLKPSELPRDSKMSAQAKKADERVHSLATDAVRATTPARRQEVYVGVITACAECHRLHPNIWGPRSSTP